VKQLKDLAGINGICLCRTREYFLEPGLPCEVNLVFLLLQG